MIGKGDYFQAQVNYTEGALRYIFHDPEQQLVRSSMATAWRIGVLSDAVYGGYGRSSRRARPACS